MTAPVHADRAETEPESDADRLRRLERTWQNEVGHALLDKPFEQPGSALVFHRQFERIASALADLGPGALVDVGCGRGQLLDYLGETPLGRHRLHVGVDVSIAVSSLPARGIAAVRADGEFLPFCDESVAAVIYNGSLHHIVDYRAALGEALRVLRPRGRLVVFEPVSSPWSRAAHRLLDPIVFRASCEYESPVDQHCKHAFREEAIVDELRKRDVPCRLEKSDFFAYPFTGCYAGSVFTRSPRLMRGLVELERFVEKTPGLRVAARIFAWRFLLVAEKPMRKVAGGIESKPLSSAASANGLPSELLALLACPRCKGMLSSVRDALACKACRLAYAIVDGVPVLLSDEASRVD